MNNRIGLKNIIYNVNHVGHLLIVLTLMSHVIYHLNREFCANNFVFCLSKRQQSRSKQQCIVLSAVQRAKKCAELCCQVYDARETQIWQTR
jgi:hypothetical protein